MKIGVVGLGLIGGSMAKAIKARTANSVYGFDLNDETMLLARLSGAIDAPLTDDEIRDADLIFIAIRPLAAIEWAKKNLPLLKKGAILVDLCGVKRKVMDEIYPLSEEYSVQFIGGHPMAGKERGKFVNSTDSLYVGASMILTPGKSAEPETLETLNMLFTDIGFSRVVFTSPEEHDRIIAYTSQLAHIASNAYIKSPEALRQRGFSAGSFKDMTRVAHLDEDMWTELFLLNDDVLKTQLEILIENLTQYKNALEERDAEKLRALLKDGREKKALAGGN